MKKFICLIVSLILIFVTLCAQNIQNIEGVWFGELDIQGSKLPLVFHIKNGENSYEATLDSPQQGMRGFPVSDVSFIEGKLVLKIPQLQAEYEGVWSDNLIKGVFTQRGQTFILDLIKGEIKSEFNRPQEPLPPYPYKEEDVFFENKEGGFKLAGTFIYPDTNSKHATVVLISGSGLQDRNEEVFGHKPFLVLADYLTRNGIAVLRFDDRSVGQSEGNAKSATTKDFSIDVRAAIDYLKGREEADSNKIGLIGHSEGGMIAFMLAAEYPEDIAYIVSMAGPGISGKDIAMLQSKKILQQVGKSEKELKESEKMLTDIINLVENNEEIYLKSNIEKIMRDILPVELQTDPIMRSLANEIARMSSPWFRFFLNYNPIEDLKKINASVFAINGEKDIQVNADINLGEIDKHLVYAKSKKIKKYPNLNHLFQTAKTGAISEYVDIEETISPEVLKDISDWIKQMTK